LINDEVGSVFSTISFDETANNFNLIQSKLSRHSNYSSKKGGVSILEERKSVESGNTKNFKIKTKKPN